MSQINRPPLGLQSLLGSQNLGDNPNNMLTDMRPTLDLLPFLTAQLLRQETVTGGRITPGTVASLQPFAGELWALKGLGAFNGAITGVGPFDLQLAFTMTKIAGGGSAEVHTLAVGDVLSVSGGDNVGFAVNFDTPLILEPGITVALNFLQCGLANADTFRLSALYFPLGF